MNYKRTAKWGLLISVALMIFLAISCSREDLTKDLNIYVGNEFLVSPITIQVADATDAQKLPDDAILTIEGKDKDKIYTLFGEKSFTLYDGVATLAVKKADMPSKLKPLEFTVVVSANNYLTKRINYTLTETEKQVDYITIINKESPPVGLSISQNTFVSNATKGVNNTIVIKSPLSNGTTEMTEVTINPNTKMMTKAGKVVEGDIKSFLMHSNAESLEAVSALPDWSNLVKVKNRTGQVVETYINPISFFELSMSNGNDKVELFSQPIKGAMYLDANAYNPAKGRRLEVGDELIVSSLSEGSEIWNEEGLVKVERANNGQLIARFDMNHLSTYTLHPADMYCIRSLEVNSSIAADGDCTSKTYFYCIVDANNPKIIYTGGTSTFANGSKLRGTAFMVNNSVKIAVFETRTSTTPIYTSAALTPCLRDDITFPSSALPYNTTSTEVRVNVSAKCTGNINATFLPSVPVLYREMGNPNAPWQLLGNISPNGSTSTGCTRKLQEGKYYDFAVAVKQAGSKFLPGATTDQLLTFTKCLKRPQGFQLIEQEFDSRSVFWGNTTEKGFQEKFQIKKIQGTQIFDLNYPNCPLPEKACNELQNKYSAFIEKKN